MPEPSQLQKAELREIIYGTQDPVQYGDLRMTVQFNPETLTVTFTNQIAGGDQNGRGAIQFAGRGTTKLNMDLWFDATQPVPGNNSQERQQPQYVDDVRKLTKQLADFMNPAGRENRSQGRNQQATFTPPALHFLWGTFLFQGVMESLTEKLEHFSEDGKPLRAMVTVSLTSQEFQFRFNDQDSGDAAGAGQGGGAPGTQPQQLARQGQTVQGIAAANGQRDWRSVASANNIENPRQLTPGQPINTNRR